MNRSDNFQWNNKDFHGYNGLIAFGDLFPDYETFKTLISNYMWFENLTTDEVISQKLFNQLFNRYKNNMFRFSNISTICTKLAPWIEEFLRFNSVVDTLYKQLTPDTIRTTNFFDTDNSQVETTEINKFLVNVEQEITNNPQEFQKQQLGSIVKVRGFEFIISSMGKALFMNKQKQVIDNSLLNQ